MIRIQHNLVQGSDAWHQFRLQHNGASEAAAMLGLSLNMKRSELLRMKHTGLAREFSEWVQKHVLDHGHAVEATARPHIEALVGEEFYPVTYSMGRLSASCDGLTLADDIAMEHKQWSESLAARVQAGEMPEEHMPQCQQVTMVTGASRCLFVVSDGTPENMVSIWVDADPAWHQRLIDGWAQFDRDLAAYALPPATEPAPVGKAPDALPALRIELTGQVTASNLAEFKATAVAAIRGVNRTLKTDADFADAEKAVKWCADVESRLKAAKDHALSQTASIDELFRALDEIAAEAKAARLDLDKLVTRRKTEVKEEAVAAARRALDLHVAAVNAEVAPMRIQPVAVDFAGAIKGKRSIDSMQDALDTALAGAKISADAQGRAIRANVAIFAQRADGLNFLFSDLGQIVHKAADDFTALVDSRIGAHKAAEAAKEARRQADEAQRIAQAEQRAREQEAARIAEQQRQQAEADRQAAAALAAAAAPAPVLAAETIPAPVVAPMPPAISRASVPASAEPATVSLGEIARRLGFTLGGSFIADVLGIHPAATDKRASLYRESQFTAICAGLVSHIDSIQQLQAA